MHDRRARCRAHACAVLLWLFAATAVHADSVYRCRNARGEIAYQDRACGAGEQQSEVALDPLPAPTAAHERASAAREHVPAAPRTRRRTRGDKAGRTDMSWQCRTADGAVFYRHGACPKSIAPSQAAAVGGRRGKGASAVGVSAMPLPRAEACRRLARERGRSGREHDEVVSTYERNAGRDPCRAY